MPFVTFNKEQKKQYAIKKKQDELYKDVKIGSEKVKEESSKFRKIIAENRRKLGLKG